MNTQRTARSIPTAPVLPSRGTPIPTAQWGTVTGAPGTQGFDSFGVSGARNVTRFQGENPPLREGEFRLATMYSGISVGTELSQYRGTNPAHAFDPTLRIFRSDAAPENAAKAVTQQMGYMEVAVVTESKSDKVKVGDVVCAPYGHRTGHTLPDTNDRFVVLSGKGVDPLLGIYVAHMGPICTNAIARLDEFFLSREMRKDLGAFAKAYPQLKTQADYGKNIGLGVKGKNVLVTGAGIVGLITALRAKAAGAKEVAIADISDAALATAKSLGLTTVNIRADALPADYAGDPKDFLKTWAKTRWSTADGRPGADAAIECTGVDAVLHSVSGAVAQDGAVVDVGFSQSGASNLKRGEEIHHNSIHHLVAQIGNIVQGISKRDLCEDTVEFLRKPAYGDALRSLIQGGYELQQMPEVFDALDKGQLRGQYYFRGPAAPESDG